MPHALSKAQQAGLSQSQHPSQHPPTQVPSCTARLRRATRYRHKGEAGGPALLRAPRGDSGIRAVPGPPLWAGRAAVCGRLPYRPGSPPGDPHGPARAAPLPQGAGLTHRRRYRPDEPRSRLLLQRRDSEAGGGAGTDGSSPREAHRAEVRPGRVPTGPRSDRAEVRPGRVPTAGPARTEPAAQRRSQPLAASPGSDALVATSGSDALSERPPEAAASRRGASQWAACGSAELRVTEGRAAKRALSNHALFKSWFFVCQVSEAERLSYVGNNFSSGAMTCSSLCRYGELATLCEKQEGESRGAAQMKWPCSLLSR
ncbi:uncharacterized protein [Excalfactoria chinensis]|uniref:uncharacterized protein n=1 Tax=Excalfactoria chinensis TaxID=46218 RepID=UPI003B39FEE5